MSLNLCPPPRALASGACPMCLGARKLLVKLSIGGWMWARCRDCRGTGVAAAFRRR